VVAQVCVSLANNHLVVRLVISAIGSGYIQTYTGVIEAVQMASLVNKRVPLFFRESAKFGA
jgi:hypothetical protein